MTVATEVPKLRRKDFVPDQEVRWCPGCGDYAVLAQIQKTMPELGNPREKIVFISGIGCSSRFPYYMNTYGIHSIHGRAPTLATGLKCARPDLQVWVVTGDGDALSIGGNHFIHALRRNVDINILLFNNKIYGLTKGQYSPTSEHGKRTKSSPDGSIDWPMNPIGVAIGAEATFIARTVDVFQKHMSDMIRRSAEHAGGCVIEIAQNCLIFNDGAWSHVSEKGICLCGGLTPKVVNVDEVGEEQLLVHDEHADEPTLAYFLSRMGPPEFPTPVGVFRSIEKPTYQDLLMGQIHAAQEKGLPDLDALYRQGETWEIEEAEA